MNGFSDIPRKAGRAVHFLLLGGELLLATCRAAWTVRYVAFKDYGPRLKSQSGNAEAPVQFSRDVRRVMHLMSLMLPKRSNCLICGIAAKSAFSRRNWASELSFGVDPAEEALVAHAWLVAGPVIVTGRAERGKYREVARF